MCKYICASINVYDSNKGETYQIFMTRKALSKTMPKLLADGVTSSAKNLLYNILNSFYASL